MSRAARHLGRSEQHSLALKLRQYRVAQRRHFQPEHLRRQAEDQEGIRQHSTGCCWQCMCREGVFWMCGKLCMGPGCAASERGLTAAC